MAQKFVLFKLTRYDTISKVKEKVEAAKCLKSTVNQYDLKYKGVILDDSKQLHSYTISRNADIEIVPKSGNDNITVVWNVGREKCGRITIDKHRKICDLKSVLGPQIGKKSQNMIIKYNNEKCLDDKTLSEYHIENNSIIYLSERKIVHGKRSVVPSTFLKKCSNIRTLTVPLLVCGSKSKINVFKEDTIAEVQEKIQRYTNIKIAEQMLLSEKGDLLDQGEMAVKATGAKEIRCISSNRIHVVVCDEVNVDLDIHTLPLCRVSRLKLIYERERLIPKEDQEWKYNQMVLADEHLIDQYGINDGSKLQVSFPTELQITLRIIDENQAPPLPKLPRKKPSHSPEGHNTDDSKYSEIKKSTLSLYSIPSGDESIPEKQPSAKQSDSNSNGDLYNPPSPTTAQVDNIKKDPASNMINREENSSSSDIDEKPNREYPVGKKCFSRDPSYKLPNPPVDALAPNNEPSNIDVEFSSDLRNSCSEKSIYHKNQLKISSAENQFKRELNSRTNRYSFPSCKPTDRLVLKNASLKAPPLPKFPGVEPSQSPEGHNTDNSKYSEKKKSTLSSTKVSRNPSIELLVPPVDNIITDNEYSTVDVYSPSVHTDRCSEISNRGKLNIQRQIENECSTVDPPNVHGACCSEITNLAVLNIQSQDSNPLTTELNSVYAKLKDLAEIVAVFVPTNISIKEEIVTLREQMKTLELNQTSLKKEVAQKADREELSKLKNQVEEAMQKIHEAIDRSKKKEAIQETNVYECSGAEQEDNANIDI